MEKLEQRLGYTFRDRALLENLQPLLKLRDPAAHRYQKFREMGLRYTNEARKDRI